MRSFRFTTGALLALGAAGFGVVLATKTPEAAVNCAGVDAIACEALTLAERFAGLVPPPWPAAPPPKSDSAGAAGNVKRARALLDAGKASEAIEPAELARAMDPASGVAAATLAEAYAALGRGEEALEELASAAKSGLSLGPEGAALATALKAEGEARAQDAAYDAARRAVASSDRAACLAAMSAECLSAVALAAARRTPDPSERAHAFLAVAKSYIKLARTAEAARIRAEAAEAARAVADRKDSSGITYPAGLARAPALAALAAAEKAAGNGEAARRTLDESLSTAQSVAATFDGTGKPLTSATRNRVEALLSVANTLKSGGDGEGAEHAFQLAARATDAAFGEARAIFTGAHPDDTKNACSQAGTQSLSWFHADTKTAADISTVLGASHPCRPFILDFAIPSMNSRRPAEALRGAVLLDPVRRAERLADLAASLASNRLYAEGAEVGRLAAKAIAALPPAEFVRAYWWDSFLHQYRRTIEKLAEAGLVAEWETAHARVPAAFAFLERPTLDAQGIAAEMAKDRNTAFERAVRTLARQGTPPTMTAARALAERMPAGSRERAYAMGTIAFELAKTDPVAAHAMLREAPRDASARQAVIENAAAIGRMDLADAALAELDAQAKPNAIAALVGGLVRAGRWDEARVRATAGPIAPHGLSWVGSRTAYIRASAGTWNASSFLSRAEGLADAARAPAPAFAADANTARTAFRLGYALASAGSLVGAARLYDAGLAARPNDAQGHYYKAETAFRLERYAEARAHYERTVQLARASNEGKLAQQALAEFAKREAGQRAELAAERQKAAQLGAVLAESAQKKAELAAAAGAQQKAAETERKAADEAKRRREGLVMGAAQDSLFWLGFYDAGRIIDAALKAGKSHELDYKSRPLFKQALAAWQGARGLPQTGELTVAVAEELEKDFVVALTWGASCFQQQNLLPWGIEGDPIMRSVIMAQARNAAAACQQNVRMNASSCQVCASPPPEIRVPLEQPRLFIE